MENSANRTNSSDKKPFVTPQLKALNVRETQTAVPDDPNEFNPYIGPVS